MPVVFDYDQDSAPVACSSSWNSDYDFAAAHSPVVEVVHRSPVVAGNHSEFRDLVVAVNRRDSRNYLVAIPVRQNHSSPA